MLGFIRSALGTQDSNVPEELVEINREWLAVKRFFDAAIIESVTDEHQLSGQLADLETKLRRIVALIYLGGKLPSSVASSSSQHVVSWERLPPSLVNRATVARCKEEGMQIFAVVCQHAKLNLPKGSRSVLASFMVEYIGMCEMTAASSTTSTPNSNTAPAGFGDLLVDERHSVCEPLVNFLSKTVNEVIRCRQFTQKQEEQEKLHYAKLIRYLCEAVASKGDKLLVPVVSVVGASSSSSSGSQQHGEQQKQGGQGQEQQHNHQQHQQQNARALADSGRLSLAWLLDLLTAFSRADDLYPVSAAALDAVLRGHLSLTMSSYDMVEVRAATLIDSLLSQLGFTFVTLCRLEENVEFADHLAVCVITMRYFDALCVFAPHVVDTAELHQRFFRFLLGTVVEMVKLPADRSFVVSMMVLTRMVDTGCIGAGSVLPPLIAQAILLHRQKVSESFFARLTDISVSVRSAAANFLLSCVQSCPTMFVSVIAAAHDAVAKKQNKKNNNNNNNNKSQQQEIQEQSQQHSIIQPDAVLSLLFPKTLVATAATAGIRHITSRNAAAASSVSASAAAAKMKNEQLQRANKNNKNDNNNNSTAAGTNENQLGSSGSNNAPQLSLCLCDSVTAQQMHNDARRRVLLAESRRNEPCPSVATLGQPFAEMSVYVVKSLRRALTYDMQQFTTHESPHCAILSGLVCELLALPDDDGLVQDFLLYHHEEDASSSHSNNAAAVASQHQPNGVLVDALVPVAKHVETRLARADATARSLILDEVLGASDSPDAALMLVQRRVPEELKAFARGAVHLMTFHDELSQMLTAKLEQQELRAVDLDE